MSLIADDFASIREGLKRVENEKRQIINEPEPVTCYAWPEGFMPTGQPVVMDWDPA